MPHTYIKDVEKIIDALCRDDGLSLKGKLILLDTLADPISEMMKQLEDKLAAPEKGLIQ